MNHKHVEDYVRRYRWPEISPEVRDRVMATQVVPAEPVTWSERIWFSRTWRVSAAAAVAVLIVLNQLGPGSPPRPPATPQMVAEAHAIEALATEVGLPAQTAAWLARRAVLEAPAVVFGGGME